MSSLNEKISTLKQDALLGKVVRNSAHLFSNNTISLGLSVLQGALVARLLAPEGLGLIKVVVAYASTVNSLFSFRMSELVVRYGGEYLGRDEKEKASAVMKAAGLVEALVSFLAFLVVALTAGLAERYFAKTSGTSWLFTVYALGLLANFNIETSTGILQVTDRIKLQGTINLIQSILTSVIIVAAFLWNGTLQIVLIAYLLSKTILGLGMFIAAQIQLHRVLGRGWWKVPLSVLTSTRELVGFAVSSNISATIIKIFRESELLWVAFFLTKAAASYYSSAYTIVIILIYSGEKFISAYPALIVLTIGFVFNYVLFWNRPLLLSLGLPEIPIKVTLVVGLVKLALAFLLVPRFGIVAAGALLSLYYIASVGTMAWRGIKEINAQAGAQPSQEHTA